jgi:hypothetical protein
MSTQPLTTAEQAAAEAIAAVRNENGYGGIEYFTAADWEDEARAVVAAVRSRIEADLLDALAEAAAVHGPPSVDHLRGIAFIARQGRSTVDWLAESAARPTSEEH